MRDAVAAPLDVAERVRLPFPLQRRLVRAQLEREVEELEQMYRKRSVREIHVRGSASGFGSQGCLGSRNDCRHCDTARKPDADARLPINTPRSVAVRPAVARRATRDT